MKINTKIIEKCIQSCIDTRLNEIIKRIKNYEISFHDFSLLLSKQAEYEMINRGEKKPKFIIDEENVNVISKLHEYIIGSENIDNTKGIILAGNFGTGKTLIMSSFLKLFEHFTIQEDRPQTIHFTKATSFNSEYKIKVSDDPCFYDKRRIFVDELGKEESVMTEYGNKTCPMYDVLCRRYETGAITFATTNYKWDDLLALYAGTLSDRLIQMFNYITLTGKSRRK